MQRRAGRIEDAFANLLQELRNKRAHWDSLLDLHRERAVETGQFLQDTVDDDPSDEALFVLSRISVLSGLASNVSVARLGAQLTELGEQLAKIRKDLDEVKRRLG
jgi:hypothetical protein